MLRVPQIGLKCNLILYKPVNIFIKKVYTKLRSAVGTII